METIRSVTMNALIQIEDGWAKISNSNENSAYE